MNMPNDPKPKNPKGDTIKQATVQKQLSFGKATTSTNQTPAPAAAGAAGKRKDHPTPSPTVIADDKKQKTVEQDPVQVQFDVRAFLPVPTGTLQGPSDEGNDDVLKIVHSSAMLDTFQHFLNSTVQVLRNELVAENVKTKLELLAENKKTKIELLTRIHTLTEENDRLNKTIVDLEQKLLNKSSPDMDNVVTTVELTNVKSELTGKIDEVQANLSQRMDDVQIKMAERLEAQEMYGRRNSIRIYGIDESTGKEDCVKVVQKFLKDKLNLTYDSTNFCRAHRVGAPDSTKNRAIIVKLVRHDTKYEIIGKRRVLAGSGFIIREDVTKERSIIMAELIQYDDKGRRLSIWSNDGRIKAKVGNDFFKIRIDFKNRAKDIAAVKAAIDKLPKSK